MKVNIINWALTTALLMSFNSFSEENYTHQDVTVESLKEQLVKNELFRRDLAWKNAKVKSKEALEKVTNRSSALDSLSLNGKQIFVDSVKFKDTGLASFNYSILEAELTVEEIYNVLAMFGAQHIISRFKNARIETNIDKMLLNDEIFGFSNIIPLGDHIDYECMGGIYSAGDETDFKIEGDKSIQANCFKSPDFICLSNCG
ncbi:hypothetical protein [Pseudoalteromonas aurantia]|uniref:Uncharacterized protein n=1 Tax=Pseudoalteromonas aurantia TaxID=43654 RepID=A0ABY2W2A3_9GAMM|nr:hypothetical protein [Pseudoalteromonas aurantia]TMO59228.1 hypothetical protein CWC18_16350 [Pseudoalteromonas aurantia]TMO78515.1 hypothetical protein CWC20_01505 [Pseudoalteromonas aurantia]